MCFSTKTNLRDNAVAKNNSADKTLRIRFQIFQFIFLWLVCKVFLRKKHCYWLGGSFWMIAWPQSISWKVPLALLLHLQSAPHGESFLVLPNSPYFWIFPCQPERNLRVLSDLSPIFTWLIKKCSQAFISQWLFWVWNTFWFLLYVISGYYSLGL